MSNFGYHTHPARPITIGNFRFRSRLEAKWAYFFQTIGWGWRYEPYQQGRYRDGGWIPDFEIGSRWGAILCEVKPISDFPDHPPQHVKDVLFKMRTNFWAWEKLLLGNGPFYRDDRLKGRPYLGYLQTTHDSRTYMATFVGPEFDEISFCADTNDTPEIADSYSRLGEDVFAFWRKACDLVAEKGR